MSLIEQVLFYATFTVFIVAFVAVGSALGSSWRMAKRMGGIKLYLVPFFIFPFVCSDSSLGPGARRLKSLALRCWLLAVDSLGTAFIIMFLGLEALGPSEELQSGV